MTPDTIDLRDPCMRRLIADAEHRAERDACSCVVSVTREGAAWAKRRRYVAELDARRQTLPWRGRTRA
jgi:hypothetical protein